MDIIIEYRCLICFNYCEIIKRSSMSMRRIFFVSILNGIGEAINGAIDFISEKKKKIVEISKIKRYIKRETNTLVKSYIALGKHYYAELRDVPNKDMQRICNLIDFSRCEINRLKTKLEEINNNCDINCCCDVLSDDEFCSRVSSCDPCNSCSDDLCKSSSASEYCCNCEPVCNCGDETEGQSNSCEPDGVDKESE